MGACYFDILQLDQLLFRKKNFSLVKSRKHLCLNFVSIFLCALCAYLVN